MFHASLIINKMHATWGGGGADMSVTGQDPLTNTDCCSPIWALDVGRHFAMPQYAFLIQ